MIHQKPRRMIRAPRRSIVRWKLRSIHAHMAKSSMIRITRDERTTLETKRNTSMTKRKRRGIISIITTSSISFMTSIEEALDMRAEVTTTPPTMDQDLTNHTTTINNTIRETLRKALMHHNILTDTRDCKSTAHTTMRFDIHKTTLRSTHTISRVKGLTKVTHTSFSRVSIMKTIIIDLLMQMHTKREERESPRKETPGCSSCTSMNRQRLVPKVPEIPEEDHQSLDEMAKHTST